MSGVEWMWRMSKRSGVDVENEQAEWMWRMSERSGCGQYLKRINILLAFEKKNSCLMSFDDNVET